MEEQRTIVLRSRNIRLQQDRMPLKSEAAPCFELLDQGSVDQFVAFRGLSHQNRASTEQPKQKDRHDVKPEGLAAAGPRYCGSLRLRRSLPRAYHVRPSKLPRAPRW